MMTKKTSFIFLLTAIVITNILFFIDEGYYDFRWMKDFGNWVAFLIYCIPIFLFQLFMYHIILKKIKGSGKTIISVMAGSALAVLSVISLMNLLH
ncbi:MAG: hypothetical protein AB9842_00995 [Bacteroidales bacterium]